MGSQYSRNDDGSCADNHVDYNSSECADVQQYRKRKLYLMEQTMHAMRDGNHGLGGTINTMVSVYVMFITTAIVYYLIVGAI